MYKSNGSFHYFLLGWVRAPYEEQQAGYHKVCLFGTLKKDCIDRESHRRNEGFINIPSSGV